MADVPFYMEGSQTGGILQNLPPAEGTSQSYIAPLPGGQPAGYTPGYGQAPMAAGGDPKISSAIADASAGGAGIDWPRVQRQLGYSNAQMDSMIQSGGFSSYVNPQGTGPATTSATGSDPWLSPDELRAKTNALQSNLFSGQSGGGGGGAGDGTGAGGAGDGTGTGAGGRGLNLSGTQGGAPTGSTAGALNQSMTPINGTVGYRDPGAVNNTNTVGYIGPGGTNSGGQAGVLQMQPANAQSALDQYKNTAGYQLLNAPGAYEQSPGYQYAMDQALGQVQQGASARGMLESGAVLRDMQKTASGLAQQDYGNWWNRQNQLYGDYQNRLQGLAGGPTGSADAMTAGANAAQANLQTGSNLGSLFGNQGTTGMGGIINTAAAQSGNMINAGQQQATVNAANQATQLAGATLASNQQKPQGLF